MEIGCTREALMDIVKLTLPTVCSKRESAEENGGQRIWADDLMPGSDLILVTQLKERRSADQFGVSVKRPFTAHVRFWNACLIADYSASTIGAWQPT
jgi:hypothetical protein